MNGQFEIGDIVLKQWTIKRLIGEGSHGRVFEIEREGYGHVYKSALKIITIPQNQSEVKSVIADGLSQESVASYFRSFVEELVEEFSLMSKLKGNSNIVSYEDHDVIPHEGRIGWDILIRMELLTPLLNYVEGRVLTQKDIVQLGIDMCKALQLCQMFNIIHRDVKPENILISETGDFKLGDFKIAGAVEKTTNGLLRNGSYTYMAPEMYSGETYSSNVDIYSLGIVLYRLLNENRIPFLPEYPAEFTHRDREIALAKRMSGLPLTAPRNADRQLAAIILKACAHDPKDRYSSPAQMREDLATTLHSGNEQTAAYPIDVNATMKPGESKNTEPLPPPVYESTVKEAPANRVFEAKADAGTKLPVYIPTAYEKSPPLQGANSNETQLHLHSADAINTQHPFHTPDVNNAKPPLNGYNINETQVARPSSYIPLRELPATDRKKAQPIIKIGIPAAAVLILALVLLFIFTKPDNDVHADDYLRSKSPTTDTSEISPSPSGDTLNADNVPNAGNAFSVDNLFSVDEKVNVDDEYDADGNLIKRILKGTVGEITGWLEFAYHENGNIKEKIECDADGNTIKRGFFDENGRLSYYWINRYDNYGRRIFSIKYNENSVQTLSHEFVYNDAGVNTRKIDRWYSDEGVLVRSVVNELYDTGRTRTASLYAYEEAGERLYETQEYSPDGKLILDTFFEYSESGSVETRTVNEYDEETELLEFIHIYNDSDVKVLLMEFDYDGNGAETERRENDLNASGAVVKTRYFRPGAATPYRTSPEPSFAPAPTPSQDSASSTSPAPIPPCGGGPNHGIYYDQVPVLSFNEQGYKTRETFYYLCGCVSHYFEYTYNDEGNVTNITKYDVW